MLQNLRSSLIIARLCHYFQAKSVRKQIICLGKSYFDELTLGYLQAAFAEVFVSIPIWVHENSPLRKILYFMWQNDLG